MADPNHFNADPDPAFDSNADPDQAYHFNTDLNSAPLHVDGNLRLLVCRPSMVPY